MDGGGSALRRHRSSWWPSAPWCAALSFVLLVCSAGFANAQEGSCGKDVHAVLSRNLKLPSLAAAEQGGNIVSEACKPWPDNPRMTVAAIAFDEGVQYEKQLVVALLETRSGRVASHYRNAIVEDATTEVGAGSLTLDTARYRLSPSLRAFGYRFRSTARGASCGEANWNDELTLLVPEGSRLRPVFSLALFQQRSLKGCLSVQSQGAVWQDAVLTLEMEKPSSNGFHDIRVTASVTTTTNGDAAAPSPASAEHHVFRYDGKVYQPGPEKPWWAGF